MRHPLLALLATFVLMAGALRADDPLVPPPEFQKADGSLDLAKVVAHFEDLYRSTSSIAVAELRVTRPRGERALRMRTWSKGRDQALVVILSPPREKGTATLKVDDNLWNYLPRIRRTIRIPPSMMLSPWMGSDFTNDDLVRESSYSEDYAYELVGESKEPAGWLIRFTAKPDVVGLWSRFDLVVSPDGTIPVVSRWYNRKGELSRTLSWDQVREFDGKRLPARMTLVPEDRDDTGHKTTMTYEEIDFDVELPEGTFSLSRLERQE
jgi:outer membrane lipoprotein-sorting protein